MSRYRPSQTVRMLALLVLALALTVSGCAPPPDLGPSGEEVVPIEDDGIAPVPPEPPLVEGEPDPNPAVVLTAEAGGQHSPVISVSLERMVASDETLYEDALVPGMQLAIRQINESGFLGEAQQMALIVNGAVLPADPTTPILDEQVALDNIVASLGPLLPYADSDERALPLALRPDLGTDVFGTSQYVDNWVYQPELVSEDLTLETLLAARDYLNLNTIALISAGVTEADLEPFVLELEAQGFDVVVAVTLDEGYSAADLLLEIGEANPNAIVLNTPVTVAADVLLAAQGMEYPTPTYIIGGAGVVGPQLVALAGDAAQGLIGGVDWMIVHPFAPNEGFTEAFQTIYGVDPDDVGAKGYAAIWLLAEAIRMTSDADAGNIRTTLATLTQVETPFGVFTTEAAMLDSAVLVQVNEDGEIVLMGE